MPVFGVQVLSMSPSDLNTHPLVSIWGVSMWVQELPSTALLAHAATGCPWYLGN